MDTNLFKAVGIIEGEIKLSNDKEKPSTIEIAGKIYNLLTVPTIKGHKAKNALKLQIKKHGSKQKLIVYPRILHLPGKDQQHQIAFSIVGFKSDNQSNSLWNDLRVNDFFISGLFQRIPVCKHPVLTVFKNLSQDRIEFVKKSNAIVRAGFMKSNHVPITYHNPVVPAYRYVKDVKPEDQNVKYFVEIKTVFDPNKNLFVFDSLIGIPSKEAPKYLHVSKKDKLEAFALKRENKRTMLNASKIPRKIPPKPIKKNESKKIIPNTLKPVIKPVIKQK